MSGETLHSRLRPAAGDAQAAFVLFHGRGADEYDLEPLLDALDPERRLVGVLPRGPLSLPPGGAHWYVVPRVGYPDAATFQATYACAADWLDALEQTTGVPLSRTVLGGFSQGAVMSLALGLGRGRPNPAGVMALSGFVPTVEGFAVELEPRGGLPVAIAHGSLDPVIGVEFGRAARDLLAAGGLAVSYREAPIGHSIEPAAIPWLRTWLSAATGVSAAPPPAAG